MMKSGEFWRNSDQISLFLIALMLLLVLLLGGLILTDRSLTHGMDRQAAVDAATSATIVAQEVELTGEWLREMSTTSRQQASHGGLIAVSRSAMRGRRMRGVWLFDSLGASVVDSVLWDSLSAERIPGGLVRHLAREAAAKQRLVLYDVPKRHPAQEGIALLAEPVIDSGVIADVAVGIVDEADLLAPAATASVAGRAFLALVVNGDTVAQATYGSKAERRSTPVRIPLPGTPEWSLVTAQSFGQNTARWMIWLIGTVAVSLLFMALVRERAQTHRIAERSVELERLSAELLRANRMKSEFLANVSHELRTPLNAMVGFVDLLREGAYGELSAKQVAPVERIAASAARLRLLVDEVLDMAKIAAGRLDVRREPVSLRPFLLNVLSEIEPLVDRNRLAVSVSVPAEVPRVATDPTHLRQILINLVGNAVKYTKTGSIEIRVRPDQTGPDRRTLATTGQHPIPRMDQGKGGWVAIDVVDTGIGIPLADQERIFEEFEQVRQPEGGEARERGTGLGLPISRRLATLLGGDVTVESEPGRGSIFTVWLPAQD